MVDALECTLGLIGSTSFREAGIRKSKDVFFSLEILHNVLGTVIHVQFMMAQGEHNEEVGCGRPSRAIVGGGDAIDSLSPAPGLLRLVGGVDNCAH